MLPLLQKAAAFGGASGELHASRAAVLNMTSMAGSITRTGVEFTVDLGVPSYKTSKVCIFQFSNVEVLKQYKCIKKNNISVNTASQV